MVQHCLDALTFESGLCEAWVGVALEWALHARNRHLACRSQQVRQTCNTKVHISGDHFPFRPGSSFEGGSYVVQRNHLAHVRGEDCKHIHSC
jgi:hypothetical protein